MNYELAAYTPELQAQLVALRCAAFGGTLASTRAHLQWKYEENPYLDQPLLHVALFEGRVVGMRGWYGSRWRVGGDPRAWTIPCGADFVVDQSHRGRGLASRLLTHSLEGPAAKGYEYVFSLSANQTTRLLQFRCGWKRVAPYHTWGRGERPQPAMTNRPDVRRYPNVFARAQRRAARMLGDWRVQPPFHWFDAWASRLDGPLVATAAPRVQEMATLASRYHDQSRIHQVRDETFYGWRFRNPLSEYRFVFHTQHGDLDGFVVLQQPQSGGVVTIVDWAVPTPGVWSALLGAVADSGADSIQITSTLFTDEQAGILERLAFSPIVQPDTRTRPAPGLYLQAVSPASTDKWSLGHQRLLDSGGWDVRMIDADSH